MENITNKTLLTTMIIIGVVIALMIIPLYPKSYVTTRNLRASAFDSVVSTNQNNANLGIYMNTNYNVSDFRTSNTRTITETSSVPTSTKTYYYSTYENTTSLPDETGYGSYYGYVPAGCESGTDYSLTTGEPCG
jgi:hypothetical protein